MSDRNQPIIKTVADRRLLYVMATDAEYGDALKQSIVPLNCGVGPVEAALSLSRFMAQQSEIDLVISLGSAGSRTLEQASVYQVGSVSYRDMDASAFGFSKGETPFLGLPAQIDIRHRIPDVPAASISTGANVVSGEAYDAVDADMVDMETWAILRASMVANVPMIGLRGISDGAEPVAEYADWTRYLKVIDERLAQTVALLEKALEQGHPDLSL